MVLMVLGSLKSELQKLIGFYRPKQVYSRKRQCLYLARHHNHHLYFGITGMGGANVGRFFQSMREQAVRPLPELVLSTGYAGAMDPSLRAGDIVMASSVVNAEDGATMALKSLPGAGPVRAAGCCTVARPADSGAKAELLRRYPDCGFVDMESWHVARACEEAGLGLAVVRCITDAAGDRLPAALMTDSMARLPAAALLGALLARPLDILRLARFLFHVRAAGKNITAFVKEAVSRLLAPVP